LRTFYCVIVSTDIGAEFGDVRPLDNARIQAMKENSVQLLDHIDADTAFVSELAHVECITLPQRDHLLNIAQPRDRNDKLLKILTRRSVADWKKFIKVLPVEQAHLFQFLVADGGEKLLRIELLLYLSKPAIGRFGIERHPYTKSCIDQIPCVCVCNYSQTSEPICVKIIPANRTSYADCYRLLRFEIFTHTIFEPSKTPFLGPHSIKPNGNRGLHISGSN